MGIFTRLRRFASRATRRARGAVTRRACEPRHRIDDLERAASARPRRERTALRQVPTPPQADPSLSRAARARTAARRAATASRPYRGGGAAILRRAELARGGMEGFSRHRSGRGAILGRGGTSRRPRTRSRRRRLNLSSSERICWLTADCVMKFRSAASEKLCKSTRSQKTLRVSMCISKAWVG